MSSARRFPPPWTAIEPSESFEIRDASGQPLAFVYFEDREDRRHQMKRLTRDEARRIAANVARLPDLLAKPTKPADRPALATEIEGKCKAMADAARQCGLVALAYLLESASLEAGQHTR